MTVLEIVTFPSEILLKPARAVDRTDDSGIQKLIDDMADTMYVRQGVGLAAVQVGSDNRIIIYDISDERDKRQYSVVINPEIIDSGGDYLSENEGCLSLPDFRANVRRVATVKVTGLDRHGQPIDILAEDLEAVVLQHEIDHLNGVLLLDRASLLKREIYKKKVRKKLQSK